MPAKSNKSCDTCANRRPNICISCYGFRNWKETKGTEYITATKRDAIYAARELHYPDEIIRRIEQATNEAEIMNALATGRHGGR